jgi:transketolase
MNNKTTSTDLFAQEIRKKSLEMVFRAKASHIGGVLSMVDILAVLYNDILNIDAAFLNNQNRDRFLLSKGHACVGLYATLALKGFYPKELLETYTVNGSDFLSHTNHSIPGVEISAGSLGHALSVSCGLAIAAKRKHETWKTYCLVGDGDLNEGSNWESILCAPQFKLDNLILIVDYNKIQSFGTVHEVMNLESLTDKFKAFNWETFEVDGHNCNSLKDVFQKAQNQNGLPKVIIAHTIKGKGVSFMENKLLWHYKSPTEVELNMALNEINGIDKK